MIRNLIALTALATVTLAAPAFAETEIHVSLVGKSPAEAYAAIAKAAHTVCKAEPGIDIYNVYNHADCEKATVAATIAKVGSPALAQYAVNRAAMLMQVASN